MENDLPHTSEDNKLPHIYPRLTDDINLIGDYKSKLNNLRIKDFENDLTFLTDKINHYKKLFRRWKKFDIAVRYFDILTGSLLGAAGITFSVLATSGLILLPATAILLTAFPLTFSLAHGFLNFSIIKRRRKKYNAIIKELETCKNKLFLYHQKCLSDNILTDEEISTSKLIVEEIINKILKIKIVEEEIDQQDNKRNNDFLLQKVKEMESLINQPSPKVKKKLN